MAFYHQTAGKNVRSILANGFNTDTWISDVPDLQDARDQSLNSEDKTDPLPGDFLLEIDIPESVVLQHDTSGGIRKNSWRLPAEILNRYPPKLIKHDYEEEDPASLAKSVSDEIEAGRPLRAEKYRRATEVLDRTWNPWVAITR
jgi:hypothetical protein